MSFVDKNAIKNDLNTAGLGGKTSKAGQAAGGDSLEFEYEDQPINGKTKDVFYGEEALECETVGESGEDSTDSKNIEESEDEIAILKDRYVRLQAEWDNYRKRTEIERAQERSRASVRLVEKLLPVLDDMERALEHAESSSPEAILEGVAAVNQKLTSILTNEGLQCINPENEAFDGDLHQAVASIEDDSVAHETIKDVYQKGYVMGDRILRPAMVAVSQGGPERTDDN